MSSAVGFVEGAACAVFNLSQSKTLPEFLEEALKRHRSLKHDAAFKERLEVIQGFEFATHCNRVRVSGDGRYVGAVGMYPPALKVYDAVDLSMKFERRTDFEAVDFRFLTPDFKKLVMLLGDRTLEFHDKGGRHHRQRVPTFGRHLEFDERAAELLITSASAHVYRLDLYEGRFLEPLLANMEDTSHACLLEGDAVAVCGLSPRCEIFDRRTGITAVSDFCVDPDSAAVTALAYHAGSHLLGCGTQDGLVKLYDVRKFGDALTVKDHQVDSAIRDLHFLDVRNEIDEELAVLSADAWTVKVWRPTSGRIENIASFDSQAKISSVCPYPRSGLVFVAQEFTRVGVHFIPAVGLAPAWSPFVDQIVEDVRSSRNAAVFDDFDFVTQADLQRLGASVNTLQHSVRPYQHGFLIAKTQHRKLLRDRALLSKAEMRESLIQKRLHEEEEKQPLRLRSIFKTRSQEAAAEALLEATDGGVDDADLNDRRAQRKRRAVASVVTDERFRSLLV